MWNLPATTRNQTESGFVANPAGAGEAGSPTIAYPFGGGMILSPRLKVFVDFVWRSCLERCFPDRYHPTAKLLHRSIVFFQNPATTVRLRACPGSPSAKEPMAVRRIRPRPSSQGKRRRGGLRAKITENHHARRINHSNATHERKRIPYNFRVVQGRMPGTLRHMRGSGKAGTGSGSRFTRRAGGTPDRRMPGGRNCHGGQ